MCTAGKDKDIICYLSSTIADDAKDSEDTAKGRSCEVRPEGQTSALT